MATIITWPVRTIDVAQADLTPIVGTLYEMDTDALRLELKAQEADTDGMLYPDTHRHNTEVTVAGVTFARTIELINFYTIEVEDGTYSVRLTGSNNNLFDVENNILVQNGVQLIAQNSAGLIKVVTGGIGTPAEVADAVWDANTADHTTAGTFGAWLQKLLTVAKFLGLK